MFYHENYRFDYRPPEPGEQAVAGGGVPGLRVPEQQADRYLGYRYTVALPEKGLDKINVRIDGDKLMDAPDGYAEVRFDGLEVFIYWSQGQPQVGAKATGIHLVNPKA